MNKQIWWLILLSSFAHEARAETFAVRPVVFCHPGTWCAEFATEAELRAAIDKSIFTMNVVYSTTKFSFRALPAIIVHDLRFSTMTTDKSTPNFNVYNEPMSDLLEELIALYAAPDPGVITMLLGQSATTCYSGVPCPGTS